MAGFFYGDQKPQVRTPEDVAAARQRMAQAYQGALGQRASTIGQGLGSLANALVYRSQNKKAQQWQQEGQESARAAMEAIYARMGGSGAAGDGGAPPASPAAAPATPDRAALYDAVAKAESNFNPNAVSPVGAVGEMQIMPATAMDPGYGVPNVYDVAKAQGLEVPVGDEAAVRAALKDPAVSRGIGEPYLEAMIKRAGGDVDKALAMYNAGPGRVDQVGMEGLPTETKEYIQRVKSNLGGDPAATAAVTQQVAQTGGIPDIRTLTQALENPWLSDGQRRVIGAMVDAQLGQMFPEGISPYQQERLNIDRQKLELEARKRGQTIKVGPDGSLEITDGGYGQPGEAPRVKLTEGQAKSSTYLQRAQGASDILDQNEEALNSLWNTTAGAIPYVGNYLQSEEYQLARNAGEVWLQAILRKDTGAAITKDEQELYGTTFLPQPGDAPAVMAQKREMRKVAQQALDAGLPKEEILRVSQLPAAEAEAILRSARGADGGAAPPAQGGDIPRITNDAEYEALPPGTEFIAPDGTTRRKN